jgi:16S rRNA (cytosine1402-N4)-methyltransferase
MRLDRESHLSAATVVNRWSEKRLAETFHVYGEERHSRRIARGIVRARQRERIETTKDLADVVIRSLPPAVKRSRWRIHPATRVFQAIRIVVNSELENLEMFCSKIFSCLRPGGRVGIISFHSLEDRIVKVAFRDAAGEGLARVITRRPVSASPQEVERNPRSRSAKLRVAERVKEE